MAQTQQHKSSKKDQQISFNFAYSQNVDILNRETQKEVKEGERRTIVCMIPKGEVTEKRVRTGYHLQQILFNVDFRFGHDGLNMMAKQAGINLQELQHGNVIVFFNSAKTSMKVAFSDQDIFHHRQPNRIEERSIPEIMKKLNNTGKIDYPDALANFLTRSINKRHVN